MSGLQDLLDLYGFIVIAYTVQEEYDEELRTGLVSGHTVNSLIPDEQLMRVIGTATPEEWATQCVACGDPVHLPGLEDPPVGFLKVITE